MKNKILVICSFFFFVNSLFSQDHKNLSEINIQIWQPFTQAFETNNYQLFASIHSKDLVRVSGDGKSIKTYTEYIKGYKKRWENTEREQTISFRFLERINTDNYASERGIYRLTVNINSAEEKSYYGKFHVTLKKEDGKWKLIMDYDSSELKTIDKTSYKEAFAIDDFEKY